ncbi:hypothetical protein RYA07_28160, partial [Pseudomonas syringae pv. actinidiae]|nr:hypothetical protein [Pseudomonas syringae pv. actinidiae]
CLQRCNQRASIDDFTEHLFLRQYTRSLIPNLSKGCCIITGTSFDLPMTLQIEKLNFARQPDSEDVNLEKLWASEKNFDNLV